MLTGTEHNELLSQGFHHFPEERVPAPVLTETICGGCGRRCLIFIGEKGFIPSEYRLCHCDLRAVGGYWRITGIGRMELENPPERRD